MFLIVYRMVIVVVCIAIESDGTVVVVLVSQGLFQEFYPPLLPIQPVSHLLVVSQHGLVRVHQEGHLSLHLLQTTLVTEVLILLLGRLDVRVLSTALPTVFLQNVGQDLLVASEGLLLGMVMTLFQKDVLSLVEVIPGIDTGVFLGGIAKDSVVGRGGVVGDLVEGVSFGSVFEVFLVVLLEFLESGVGTDYVVDVFAALRLFQLASFHFGALDHVVLFWYREYLVVLLFFPGRRTLWLFWQLQLYFETGLVPLLGAELQQSVVALSLLFVDGFESVADDHLVFQVFLCADLVHAEYLADFEGLVHVGGVLYGSDLHDVVGLEEELHVRVGARLGSFVVALPLAHQFESYYYNRQSTSPLSVKWSLSVYTILVLINQMNGISGTKGRKQSERKRRHKQTIEQLNRENDENAPVLRKRMSTSAEKNFKRTEMMKGVLEEFEKRKRSRKPTRKRAEGMEKVSEKDSEEEVTEVPAPPRFETKDRTTPVCLYYQNVLSQLNEYALPKEIPCRMEEKGIISDFIQEGVRKKGKSSTLYISGVPGTGKTATFMEVVKEQQSRHGKDLLFIHINSLHLSNAEEVYSLVSKQMLQIDLNPSKACHVLDTFFRFGQLPGGKWQYEKKQAVVVLLDEMDFLIKKKEQQVLYNLFEWSHCAYSRLVIIGIANTMDMTDLLSSKILSRMGNDRLVYKPYSQEQITKIIDTRLRGIASYEGKSIFENQSIGFLALKISRYSTDIRKALHIVRQAVNKAFDTYKQSGQFTPVTVQDMIETHSSSMQSWLNQNLNSLSQTEQEALLCLASCVQKRQQNHCYFSELSVCFQNVMARQHKHFDMRSLEQRLHAFQHCGLIEMKQKTWVHSAQHRREIGLVYPGHPFRANGLDFSLTLLIDIDDVKYLLESNLSVQGLKYLFN